MYKPIDSGEFPGNDVKWSISKEPIVETRGFVFEPFYSNRGIKGAIDKCYMRKTLCTKLKEAQRYLPEGYRFKIYDAWRPFEVQLALYEDYRAIVAENNPGLSDEEVDNLTKLFVSKPIRDEFLGPVHATGGAIDLTIVDETGNELNMGTEFDFFGDEANTDYYENNPGDDAVKNNRRMLYNAMIKAGFTNLPTEWWHYDFGNRFNSYYTGENAVYGCVFDVV